ncbi:MAG TPA: DNA topoisomerase, partial [Rhizomicrobium sp.]
EEVARYIDGDAAKLYELIWKRAVASQMESAKKERTTVEIISADKKITLRATGTVILFDGFLTLYLEGEDDPATEEGSKLPKVSAGDAAKVENVNSAQHFTEPPPRYSEASLVKKLEELGIGRPSTYATILSTLRDRAYVRQDRGRFYPEDKGRLVTTFLQSFFRRYVEYDFTADLEEQLDKVAEHKLDWKALLRDFWTNFSAAVAGTKDLKIRQVIDELDSVMGPYIFPVGEDGADPRKCPNCENGRLNLKLGRFGAFVGCSNYPECKFTRQIGAKPGEGDAGPRELGLFPGTETQVTLRSGRFGPYVQLGEGEKPKRSSLPKGWIPTAMDLEKALRLLKLPRDVGAHPEDGAMITAGIGRYGPFVLHAGTYAHLS